MNMKQNLHTHTTYADGKNTPEEMILEAVKRGFNSIGFSEHTYMPFSTYPYQMTPEAMLDYKKEIFLLKEKYKDVIDVFCGLEYEKYSDLKTDGFDYIIGSVHYLNTSSGILGFDRGLDETLTYINDNFGGDGMRFAKKYFEELSLLPDKVRGVDIIGHFDLLVKNNDKGRFIDTSSKEYLSLGFEAIHALKGKIPFFEVNTGAISRGYKSAPFPSIEFLKELRRLGFGAVITSDCHDKNFIDCFFEESKDILLEAGFNSKWILTDNGFKEVSL